MNNPLKYVDPSGNIVNCEDDEIQAAWDLFADTCPDIAQILIDSEIVFNLDWGDTTLAYTQVTSTHTNGDAAVVEVVFGRDSINPDREGIEGVSYVLAHETVHCYGIILNPQGNYPTLYEETIAMQFQESYGQEIGYEPVSHWWESIWTWATGGTDMQKAEKVVERAQNVNLTGEPSYTLVTQLANVFQNSTYWGSYYTYYLYSAYYWATMNKLEEVFLE